MIVGDEFRLRQFERTRLIIHVPAVRQDIHHPGDEHVVRAERDDLLHLALDGEGRLLDEHAMDDLRRCGGELHLLELIEIPARTHTAPVGRIGERLVGEVDDELPVAFDDLVGVPGRANGDVAHGRVRAYRARPTSRKEVVFLLVLAAGNQCGRHRVNHRSWFEPFFHVRLSLNHSTQRILREGIKFNTHANDAHGRFSEERP